MFAAALCLWLAHAPAAQGVPSRAGGDVDFPRPKAIEPAVAFWKRVYLEATTDGGLIHDSSELGVVYEVLQFGNVKSQRRRDSIVKTRKHHWRDVLHRLRRNQPPRNDAEAQIPALFERALGRKPTPRDYSLASRRIRFQLGQRNKFRAGLIRSGSYEDAMRAIFHARGLPEDLAYLPHVESSFNLQAYSKYGAAGVWQFMRSTGRHYMHIDYNVDERLDPMKATHAAAKLLQENYQALGTWPLAITAYNHGRAGMKRAQRKVGTSDIGKIIRNYRSRTFGFASRNFYAQFLAAREIVRSYESYFGPLRRDLPEPVDEIELPFYAEVEELRADLGVSPEVIQHYNPALRPPIFRSKKRIPKGFVLRLPAGTVKPDVATWLASVPEPHRHSEQRRLRYYQVRRGDTLGRIARRHGTSVDALVVQNNLPSRHRIFPGQVLELPGPNGGPSRPSLVRTAQAATPEPKPTAEPKSKPELEAESSTARAAAPGSRPDSGQEPPAAKPEQAPAGSAPAPPDAGPATGDQTAPAERLAKRGASPSPPSTPTSGSTTESAASGSATPAEAVARPASEGGAHIALPPLPEDSPWRRIDGTYAIVDSLETLGHFADWLELPTQRLRDLNGLRYGSALHMGQRLQLDFSRVSPDVLLQKRMEFHKSIEEDFFGSYRITGTQDHTTERGESLWVLSNRVYGVPAWLIHRYNPSVDLTQLQPGTDLEIPIVEPLTGGG